jgi:regulator of sigma E protease
MMALLSVVIGIFILGIMVIIHELGHFIIAKVLRFRVLAFSIGFGKALVKKTFGETEYRIGVIPFGGYVKMAGEQPDDEHIGESYEFMVKPKWQRAAVAVAGPLANFLSAILMLWIMYQYGIEHPKYLDRPIVGYVADSSAAGDAGICAGDSIFAINGESVDSWNGLEDHFMTPENPVTLSVARGGATLTRKIHREPKRGEEYAAPFGMEPSLPAVVGRVSDTLPAARAGITSGDTILSIDSARVYSWYQIAFFLQKGKPGQVRQVGIGRASMHTTLAIMPYFDQGTGRSVLGIELQRPPVKLVRFSPGSAIGRCLHKTWDFTTMIFDVLGQLISRKVSTSELSGPVGIIPASGIIALQGLSPMLNFMALISINLAVLNLFPLIITDGGLLLFLLLEAIRRKPLSLRTQSAINRFAIVFFIAFFIYVSMNDLHRLPDIFRLFGK